VTVAACGFSHHHPNTEPLILVVAAFFYFCVQLKEKAFNLWESLCHHGVGFRKRSEKITNRCMRRAIVLSHWIFEVWQQ
jgi:hypothetical protein